MSTSKAVSHRPDSWGMAVPAPVPAELGTITAEEIRTTVVNVRVTSPVTVDEHTIVLLRVNGQTVKRLTAGKAAAMGLVTGVEPTYPADRRRPPTEEELANIKGARPQY